MDNPVEELKDLLGMITVQFATLMQGGDIDPGPGSARGGSPHVDGTKTRLWKKRYRTEGRNK